MAPPINGCVKFMYVYIHVLGQIELKRKNFHFPIFAKIMREFIFAFRGNLFRFSHAS